MFRLPVLAWAENMIAEGPMTQSFSEGTNPGGVIVSPRIRTPSGFIPPAQGCPDSAGLPWVLVPRRNQPQRGCLISCVDPGCRMIQPRWGWGGFSARNPGWARVCGPTPGIGMNPVGVRGDRLDRKRQAPSQDAARSATAASNNASSSAEVPRSRSTTVRAQPT